jgi:tetratricopeptide (TPR) repeat protein
MSLKAELETWALALKSYEADDLEGAIARFDQIADTSKICWNVGIILATLGRHEEAVERFAEATAMDGFFTVAYQQKGVSNFVRCLACAIGLSLITDAGTV